MFNLVTFGERLRELRKSKDMTATALADFLGVSRRLITFYETNEREPNYETLKKLSVLFECSTDYLLGRIDNKIPNLIDYVNLAKNHPNSTMPDDLVELLENLKIPDESAGDFIKLLRHLTYLQDEGMKKKNEESQ